MDWDDDKQKAIMDLLQPPGMQQGLNTAQAMGIGAPAAGGGSPPLPPTISSKVQPLEQNDNPEEDKSNTVDSHPLSQLPNYIQQQEQQVDKYSPDKQQAVLDMIQKEQGGWQGRLGRGLSGAADGIMQGVARAGPGHFQDNFQANQKDQLDRQAAALPQLQEMNAKNMAAKQGLEAQTNKSPLGAAASTTLSTIFSAMGIPKAKLSALMTNPALAKEVLEPYSKYMSESMKTKVEDELRVMQLKLDAQRNAEMAEHGKAEIGVAQEGKDIEKEKARREALQETAKHGILHPINAYKASQALANSGGVGNFTPDVTSYAQRHGITPEQAQAIKDKRTAQ